MNISKKLHLLDSELFQPAITVLAIARRKGLKISIFSVNKTVKKGMKAFKLVEQKNGKNYHDSELVNEYIDLLKSKIEKGKIKDRFNFKGNKIVLKPIIEEEIKEIDK